MKSLTFRLGLATATIALAAAPALAQKPGNSGGSPAADRPVAVDRPAIGGDRGGSSTVSSGSSTTASSGGSESTPSAASVTSPIMGFGSARAAYREEAPQHRTSSGSHSSGQAVTRGSAGSSSAASSGSTRSSSPARAQGSTPTRNEGSQAVPNWARPRGDRPATGTAVTRTTPRPDGRGGYYNNRYYDPFGFYTSPYYYGDYFSPYGMYSPYGLYSPYGFYSPYALGYGFGLGFPWMMDPMMDPWGGGGGDWSDSQEYTHGVAEEQGSLRLKVKPRDAKVYVDGYFVGTIDEMDGVFQKLPLNGGKHHVAVKADGYGPEEFDVTITPHETLTYQGDLRKIQ